MTGEGVVNCWLAGADVPGIADAGAVPTGMSGHDQHC